MAYVGTSIVDYLKSIGQASDYSSRAKLAAQQGISNYTGTAQQNTQLLNALNKPVYSTPAQTSQSYTIKSGDTLSQIAQKQGTTTTALMAANPQITNPDKISAGATINVSVPSYTPPYTPPQNTQQSSSIVKRDTVQSDMLMEATAPIVTPTPTPETPQKNPLEDVVSTVPGLKELLDTLQLQLDEKIQSGQRVNPDLTITPELTAKFVDEATKELDPYYQELINQYKQDLTISSRQLQEDYNSQVKTEKQNFGQTLQNQDITEANQGTAFSSGRIDRENQIVSNQQQKLEDLYTNTQRTVEANALTAERKIGSRAFSDLGIPSLQTYSAQRNTIAPRGEFASTGDRNLYTPQTGLFGELPATEKTAIAKRAGELTQLEINKRILDSGGSLGNTSLG